jgi:hypothetical protein
MLRILTVLVVLVALAAAPVSAQPQLPLSPGVRPASPFGPGMPFRAAPGPQRLAGQANNLFFPVAMPWGWGYGWSYPTYNPWAGFGYEYGGLLPVLPPEPVEPAITEPPTPTIVLANEFPATLTLQFPAAAEVWLGDKKVSDVAKEEQVLTSPVLKMGQLYTFEVRARWTTGGKTYETKRSVTLGPSDRSRLLVVSGEQVRE